MWDDNTVDVLEQYPLPLNSTIEIASKLKFKHPFARGKLVTMTTDFLVDCSDHQEAFSVKASRNDLLKNRTQMEHLLIEATYWESIGVPYHIKYRDDINKTLSLNIQRVVYFWNLSSVYEKVGLFKHLIAHKIIRIDMETKTITSPMFRKLADGYIPDGNVIPIIEALQKNEKIDSLYQPQV